MNRQTTLLLLKLTAGLSAFTGIIALIFLIFIPKLLQNNTHIAPSPTITITPTVTISPTIGTNPEETVYCTQDVKLCPDGSSVGRVGPNCEFEACP